MQHDMEALHTSQSASSQCPRRSIAVTSTMLASEGGRSRVSVAGRNRVVDVDEDARVSVLVSAWESDKVLGRRAAATRDLKLCTRQIELGATLALGNV